MTTSSADIGYGATFAIGDGAAPEVFTAVAEVTAITAPGYSRDAEEVTTLESDNQYKEWIAGMKEHSDVTLSLNWVPNASDVMVTAFEADTGNYKITAPNAVTFTFGGFVTSYEFGEMTPGGKMTATATFKIDGKATVA